MEGVDPGIAGVPPRERRKPGDGGVFTFLFVISGLVIAAIPVVMWFYFDHNEGLKPHTVRHAPPASLLRLDPTRISKPCVSPSPAFRIIHPLGQQEMKFVPLGLGKLNGSSGR